MIKEIFGLKKQPKNLEDTKLATRELYAENIKERIYATLMLLVVLAGIVRHPEHYSPLAAFAAVAVTSFAIWAANLIAHTISHRIAHGKDRKKKDFKKLLFTASGLLLPSVVPIFFLLLAVMGVMKLGPAATASVALLITSLAIFSIQGTRRVYDGALQISLFVAIQVGLGLLIVGLKYIVE